MTEKVIEHASGSYPVQTTSSLLETSTKKGITCYWSGTVINNRINFTWIFDWSELKSQGVNKITGYIIVVSNYIRFDETTIDVKLTEDNQVITEIVHFQHPNGYDNVYFDYSLTPHYPPIPGNPDYDKMFAPCDQNDTILVVQGKKLYVSKSFLSYHSEYFRALFSSNYKEGQMDEIPIRKVSYADFVLLLSTFYPTQVFPTDKTVEKLLEMGRRFLVSSALRSAEYHLLNLSKINDEKILWLSDEYGMPTLLEKCIRELNTMEKAKKLKQSEEYKKLSDSAKAKVLDRVFSQFY